MRPIAPLTEWQESGIYNYSVERPHMFQVECDWTDRTCFPV